MPYMHLRGLVIEGMSHSGKTSLLNALKILHANKYERSLIVLAEHYSQILQNKDGTFFRPTRGDHLKLLESKLAFLSELGSWGDYLGPARMQSRGIFFVFERFHLNHLHYYRNSDISKIEANLLNCNAKTVLLTISDNEVESRLRTRDTNSTDEEIREQADQYVLDQNRFIELTKSTGVPTLIINTDEMAWERYAEMTLGYCGYQRESESL